MNPLRSDLPPLPESMTHLPVFRGYPVPWFVHWTKDGEPEFRIIGDGKMVKAINHGLCWVCGESFTNRRKSFVIGPMCAINRISAEPPCHPECARFSAQACPFLSKPVMVRREKGLPENIVVQEGHLAHNPTVAAVWHTRSYRILKVNPGILFEMGDPTNVEWFHEGKPANREQALSGLEIGVPGLLKAAKEDNNEEDMIKKINWVKENLLPRAVTVM